MDVNSNPERVPEPPSRLVEGLVLRLQGRQVLVELPEGNLPCSLRKSLFRELGGFTGPVAVGDRVRICHSGPGDAVVVEILPRRRYLSRRQPESGREQVMVANVDQVVITVSLRQPMFRQRLIDRLLVAVERGGFAGIIALTKVDLVADRAPYEAVGDLYRRLGYEVHLTSTVTGEGIENLGRLLRRRITVFAGQSGVGKSSLLNAIQPRLDLRTQAVDAKWGKGRHTTPTPSLLPLKGGGYVADTPGVRAFAIAGLEPGDVAIFFREMAPHVDDCRFSGCTHDHEPGCAVKAAVDAGLVETERYLSYLRIIHGMEEEG